MVTPLLSLRGARMVDGSRLLFEGVDLALERRTRACLVGRNGSGKSTLLRLLAGQIEMDAGERFAQPGLAIVLVAQEPRILGATLQAWAMAGGAPPHEADAALAAFDLDPRRPCEGLSGGEARRAALARAFAEKPDVLLLDEPTNHLDILAIERLEARLASESMAVLAVSHDRAFLERFTRRCYWLEDRRMARLDQGFAAFEAWAGRLADMRAEDARRLGRRVEREERWMARGVTARRTRNEGRRRRLIALRAQKAESLRLARGPLALEAGATDQSGRLVAEAAKVSKSLGGRRILGDFSTRIFRGDRLAIIGPNGAGKTTLLRLLMGEAAPDQGRVRLGANLATAYVDQARADLAGEASVRDILAPLGGDQIMVAGAPRHIAAYARDFGLRDDQLRQPVKSLSGGERNRLLLARAVAAPCNLLVLDEPTNDLDLETLDLLEQMLADFSGTLILVSHDRDFVDRLATSTICLDGRGGWVETPGGWRDFLLQNPDFLLRTPPAPLRQKQDVARPPRPPTKLSFKDLRRLGEIEARLPRLAGEIASLEVALSEPALYARDPSGFARLTAALETARASLAAAEEDWLGLQLLKEERAAAAGP